ncbi:MAG: hypothetical protein R6U50_01695 [Desulfobacterales bacterium]
MDRIDHLLDKYESDLKKADKGVCRKVNRCSEFRNGFQQDYLYKYKPILEKIAEKLIDKSHAVRIEEKASEDDFYGFRLSVVPRHLHRYPEDRYYPDSLWSSVDFFANEHTLTVDVETVVRPAVENLENRFLETIPGDRFNEEKLIKTVSQFLEDVFVQTIILHFRSP